MNADDGNSGTDNAVFISFSSDLAFHTRVRRRWKQ